MAYSTKQGKGAPLTGQARTALRSLGSRIQSEKTATPRARNAEVAAMEKSLAGTQRLIKQGKPTGLAGDTAANHPRKSPMPKKAHGRY